MSRKQKHKQMYKIAVIEDDIPIREMYEMKLKSEGYEVQGAADGQEGLTLLDKFRPDLVLLDLRMPIMDGVEMLKILRQQHWSSSVLVIILTNVSKEEAPMELRHLKVEKYIVKAHYTPKQVIEIVAETLSRHKKH